MCLASLLEILNVVEIEPMSEPVKEKRRERRRRRLRLAMEALGTFFRSLFGVK